MRGLGSEIIRKELECVELRAVSYLGEFIAVAHGKFQGWRCTTVTSWLDYGCEHEGYQAVGTRVNASISNLSP
jgi:hypothetical protein